VEMGRVILGIRIPIVPAKYFIQGLIGQSKWIIDAESERPNFQFPYHLRGQSKVSNKLPKNSSPIGLPVLIRVWQ